MFVNFARISLTDLFTFDVYVLVNTVKLSPCVDPAQTDVPLKILDRFMMVLGDKPASSPAS